MSDSVPVILCLIVLVVLHVIVVAMRNETPNSEEIVRKEIELEYARLNNSLNEI